MKKIIAKSGTLQNLMGCQNLTIELNEDITNIFGANGAGKSRFADAFQWVMFGKNANDKKDHGIKNTKDTSFNQQEHIGEFVLLVDGIENTLKRVYKEKWTKKKGSEFPEFTGHETEFYFNLVPVSATEYAKKVSDILDESVFKMITNPLYFTALPWKDQRNVLTEVCPAPSNEELAGESEEYKELISHLVQGKELADYQKQISATIIKSKEDLKNIPTRIDEALKGKSDVFDWAKLEAEQSEKETELSKIEESLTNKANAFDEVLKTENAKKIAANEIQLKLDGIIKNLTNSGQQKTDDSALKTAQNQLESKQGELLIAENGLKTLNTQSTNLTAEIKTISDSLQLKRDELKTVQEKEFIFDETQCVCPTCKREFESTDVEAKKAELKQNFNTDQSNQINVIQQSGIRLKGEKESKEAELKTITDRIEKGNTVVLNLRTEIVLLEGNVASESEKLNNTKVVEFDLENAVLNNPEYQTALKELNKIKATIQENPAVDNTELNNQKSELVTAIDEIKTKLRNKAQNDLVDKRVADLFLDQKRLASEIANVEKTLFVIEKFNKLKVESIEEQVNQRFKYVKFRLFKPLVNGGVEECCEALVNDVPYSHANTAGRLNAGIDIINLLCEHFQVTGPIFLDNRESVTDLIETKSQIINLIVSPGDETLRVE